VITLSIITPVLAAGAATAAGNPYFLLSNLQHFLLPGFSNSVLRNTPTRWIRLNEYFPFRSLPMPLWSPEISVPRFRTFWFSRFREYKLNTAHTLRPRALIPLSSHSCSRRLVFPCKYEISITCFRVFRLSWFHDFKLVLRQRARALGPHTVTLDGTVPVYPLTSGVVAGPLFPLSRFLDFPFAGLKFNTAQTPHPGAGTLDERG
jgi:hypothetical protein